MRTRQKSLISRLKKFMDKKYFKKNIKPFLTALTNLVEKEEILISDSIFLSVRWFEPIENVLCLRDQSDEYISKDYCIKKYNKLKEFSISLFNCDELIYKKKFRNKEEVLKADEYLRHTLKIYNYSIEGYRLQKIYLPDKPEPYYINKCNRDMFIIGVNTVSCIEIYQD